VDCCSVISFGARGRQEQSADPAYCTPTALGCREMADITPGSARLRSSGMSSRKVGRELAVLDFASSRYFTIRGSEIFFFELLQEEKHDREELIAALLARFDVKEDIARRDVETFLSELSSAGLLST
jgi:hypothetical protein